MSNSDLFPACRASDRFPFAQSIANANRKGELLQFSCHDRCNGTFTNEIVTTTCKCDHTCLFLGDCCYDYLVKCSRQKLSINKALVKQANSRRFFDHAICDTSYLNSPYGLRVVNQCPKYSTHSARCGAKTGTLSNFMPVVAKGIPFRNVYCAACHGMLMKDVHTISKNPGLSCAPLKDVLPVPWNIFNHKLSCSRKPNEVSSAYKTIKDRIEEYCFFDTFHPIENCDDHKYKEECQIYRAIPLENDLVKNKACLTCMIRNNKSIEGFFNNSVKQAIFHRQVIYISSSS